MRAWRPAAFSPMKKQATLAAWICTFWCVSASLSAQSYEDSQMWKAINDGDARSLRMILPVANAENRNTAGQTPLMAAAAKGSFECVRELLWAGANPSATDTQGKTARNFLKPGTRGYVPLELILRCYTQVKKVGNRQGRAGVRHRVIVNDSYVDHTNSRLRTKYHINTRELNGRTGTDDDGNGFVDDIYGWNVSDDAPMRVPGLLGAEGTVSKAWLERLMADYEAVQSEAPGYEAIQEALEERYENPLYQQIGAGLASRSGYDLDDWSYAELLVSASHGTHVAGIVLTASSGAAELHAMTMGKFREAAKGEESGLMRIVKNCEKLAPKAPTYTDFVARLRTGLLEDAVTSGKRLSAYLKTTQAGVVNMSWGVNLKALRQVANVIHDVYKEHGANPASIASFSCPIGMDLCDDMALELLVADAASLAIAMYENPDVLFVMAAGNSSENNDKILPSPAYLSRFFPNALTVASVDRYNRLSDFSNYGARSVQIAAAGEQILSDVLGGVKCRMDGTSMASPKVAGSAAAVRARFPSLTAPDVRRILLASAQTDSDLQGRVCTSGIVDVTQALRLAESWDRGIARVIDEKWDWPAGEDDAPIHGRAAQQPAKAASGGGVLQKPADSPWAITSIGGYGENSWAFVTSKGSGIKGQRVMMSKGFPNDWVGQNYKDNYRVTAVAGDSSSWIVVMSEGGYAQRLLGYDQTKMKVNVDEGFGITSIAGWGDSWAVIMDKPSKYGAQRYTLPGAWDQPRKDWIKARWSEGYRITSVAGENGPGEKFSWLVAMAQDSGLDAQAYFGPDEWPADKITDYNSRGYRITGVSGHSSDRWVVVVSTGTSLGDQKWIHSTTFPENWLRNQWALPPSTGNRSVEELAMEEVK